MIGAGADLKVYLSLGITDMRKAINGLSLIVEQQMDLDPFAGHLFVFCNRRRNIVKVLYWDRNGFCLWQKRLEQDQFRWPESETEVLQIGQRELQWLLSGLSLEQHEAHKQLHYCTVF